MTDFPKIGRSHRGSLNNRADEMHPAMLHHGSKIPPHSNKFLLFYFPPSEAWSIRVRQQTQVNCTGYFFTILE